MNRRQFLISLFAIPFLPKLQRKNPFPKIGVQIPNLKPYFYQQPPFSIDSLISFLVQNQIRHVKIPFHWDLFYPKGIGILNHQVIQFYHRLIDALKRNQITPWAQCYQNSLPASLIQNHSDWTDKTITQAFLNYINTLIRHYHDKIPYWYITENLLLESIMGYLTGQNSPFKKGDRFFISALSNMLTTLTSAFRLIKYENPNLQAGFSEAFFPILLNPYDSQIAYALDLLFNRLTLELTSGYSPPTAVFPALKNLDFPTPYSFLINPDFYGILFSHALEISPNQLNWNGKFPIPPSRLLTSTPKDYHINAFFSQIKQLTLYPSLKRIILAGHTISLPQHVESQFDEQRKHLLQLFFHMYQSSASDDLHFFAYFYNPLYDEPNFTGNAFTSGIAYWKKDYLQWKDSGNFFSSLLSRLSIKEY